MEAEIYVRVLKNITAEVAQYAKQNGIRVVRKANQFSGAVTGHSIGHVTTSSPTSGEVILVTNVTGTNVDTPKYNLVSPATGVIRVETAKAAESVRGLQFILTGAPVHNGANGTTSFDSLTFKAPENAAPNDKSGDSKTPPATGLTFINIGTTSVDGKGTLVLNSAPNPDDVIEQMKQQMRQLSQKEVLYAEPGDDFDITQEILKRMNAKFEQEQAAKKAK